ncbi:glycosyltransferase [Rothia sp. ARF10]|nr:glycosyltransferase [Rothia sp. ARF10]
MKITMVSEHASPLAVLGGVDAGGQNVHVAALARELGRLGHEVDVYTRRDDPDLAERVELGPGAHVVHVPVGPARPVPKDDLLPLMNAFGDWMRRDWERRGLPDIVHAHFWMSGLASLRATRGLNVPVAQTFHALGTVKRRHQGRDDTSPPHRISLEQRIGRDVDLVIATCRDEVRELDLMGVAARKVRVVPCGVDTTRFTPLGPAVPSPVPDALDVDALPRGRRLLAAGRLVPRKGFDEAVRALASLPDAQLFVVGGPSQDRLDTDAEARRLRLVAQECGVGDRVHLVGQVPQDEMPAWYRFADVVLATPWYEPFGITPLEAAASGRPLVGTAVGGLLDSVCDGVTGRLVPPRDVGALVGALEEVLDDEDLRTRWGAAARARAVERFDWSVVARHTEDALAQLCRPTVEATCETREWLESHTSELRAGMDSLLGQAALIRSWGERLATALVGGSRLLAAGNGGSAAEAQHLTAELVGRYRDERRPLSAIALTAETSSLTAILNDYGPDEVFARQVEAHGRPGDILVLLSTSGSSSNVLHAAKRGHEIGMTVWAMTGPAPNPLASLADEALTLSAPSTASVQEVQLVAVHALCAALDASLSARGSMTAAGAH